MASIFLARGRLTSALFAVFCLLSAGFGLLGASSSCFGYALESSSWPDGPIPMYLGIRLVSPPLTDGFASFNASAADDLNSWNQYLQRSHFVINYADSTFAAHDDDGISSVTSSSTVYGDKFGAGVLAVTLISYEGSVTSEADVLVNEAYTFDSYNGNLRRGVPDIHRVLLHEFGHVLGLDHPDDAGQNVLAVMNSHISDVDHLTADDIAGIKFLYDAKAITLDTVTLKAPVAKTVSQSAGGVLRFRVRRNATTDASPALTVHYTVISEATPGLNYKALSGIVVLPAGRAQAKIKLVTLPNGPANGPPLGFTLTLADDAAYTVGLPFSSSVTLEQ